MEDIGQAGEQPERSTALALDEIRDGSVKLLAIVRQRLVEISDLLDQGDFDQAHDRSGELYNRLGPLAAAQNLIGNMVRTYIVRARELQEGMHVGPAKLSEVIVDEHECVGGGTPHCVVTLKWETGVESQVNGDTEMLVRNALDG